VSSGSPEPLPVDVARRHNNFDALRLLAAIGVVVGHAYVLTGRPDDLWFVAGIAPHYLGVAVFFAISGWLITGSWERTRSVPQFVWSRALRILPLLWVVVLASVLVLGPLVTTLAPGAYASAAGTWHYLLNLVMLPADGLPGVFETVPYPGVVNGSLWTLRAEVLCYAAVLVLGLAPRRVQTAGFVVLTLGAVALASAGDVRVAGASLTAAGEVWAYFGVAALARLHLPRRLLHPGAALLVAALCVAVAPAVGPQWSVRLSWLAVPYVVLSVGLASWPGVRRAARFGDLSYGMYLWAFPVQQLLVRAAGPLPVALDVALVVVPCALLAFASWHLVEHPAMAARRRLRAFRVAGPPTPTGEGTAPRATSAA
jgi:peptidoglycan/LPS O-acetylase OafA/YrhL